MITGITNFMSFDTLLITMTLVLLFFVVPVFLNTLKQKNKVLLTILVGIVLTLFIFSTVVAKFDVDSIRMVIEPIRPLIEKFMPLLRHMYYGFRAIMSVEYFSATYIAFKMLEITLVMSIFFTLCYFYVENRLTLVNKDKYIIKNDNINEYQNTYNFKPLSIQTVLLI